MTSPAELIATNLQALPHPDGTPRQLPGFSTKLLPGNLQDQIQQTAKDIGEAVINLLQINGYHVVTDAELKQADDEAPPPVANLHCGMCDTRLLQLNIANPQRVVTNGKLFLEGLAQRSTECPHA